MQCGCCTPGCVVSVKSLLEKNPDPAEEECKQALAGEICCCGAYPKHAPAIAKAAETIKGGT
ncbi:MAG: aerobic-type carbon monoxide dehydrogenase, small subunit CoxS/CutS-like protein [Acidobacteria bacterium]|nr:aerobic-type carbon monoxide dehydrogenase, small subunit CoxS/CutS-like protein [Acidobacteriota bacterium]